MIMLVYVGGREDNEKGRKGVILKLERLLTLKYPG